VNCLQALKSARRGSTPLVAIRTADPAGTIETVKTSDFYHPNGKAKGNAALLCWDIVNGLRAIDRADDAAKPGEAALQACLGQAEQAQTTNPVEALTMLQKMPPGGICFMQNAHRFIEDAGICQAIWNLRDNFKSRMSMLVMLCPSITLPSELQQDILILDEALPTDAELKAIALDLYKGVQLPVPDAKTIERIIDATLGLAAFPAEQAMAMSLTKQGMDLIQLWERKRQLIDGNPGLSVWRGTEKFDDIGGCENIKDFLRSVIKGKNPPRAICFIDEIEKAIGTGQDTSGVSQGLLGQLLTWMQDNAATGIILVGPPGAAKSALSKAAGNEAGIPTIAFDLGGTKASLVGESEGRMRTALKVIDAVSQKRTMFIATCNSLSVLPTELLRRFTFGVFFADLPDSTERAKIWEIYRKKYDIPAEYELPDDEGWTGAECKQCAELSWRLQRPLVEAATFIVPVCRSAADKIAKLRSEAHGKFISVSYPGPYQYKKAEPVSIGAGRRISFDQGVN